MKTFGLQEDYRGHVNAYDANLIFTKHGDGDVYKRQRQDALTEFDAAVPNTVYGKSKLAGEMLVRELNPKHLVIRSSWMYGDGKNFVSELLDKIKAGEEVRVAYDQVSTPTSTDALARGILELMESEEYGVYHASCEGFCLSLIHI